MLQIILVMACRRGGIVKNLFLALLLFPSLLVAQSPSVLTKSLVLTHVTVIDATGSLSRIPSAILILSDRYGISSKS